ncbi:MAG: tRNA threonylcarbamoyladenosine dehydratase [Flammeovirgaceae bacterium]|nr:tRNA threonylcarbamoyladenosine dehydratase [Flammeovirgaceae bacterium]MDW8287745.1 tRNA threonylcarbamoyladenosine dehydratase [Flammeovirgaceae bacterium]
MEVKNERKPIHFRHPQWMKRTELLLGSEKIDLLQKAHVLVVGLGGIGGAAAEMIARAGVGKMTLVDGDVVEASNRNRQLCALQSTDNQLKSEVFAARLKDINPDIVLTVISDYLKDAKITDLLSQPYDYVVDCIDTLSPKVYFLYHAVLNKHRIVSAMGAGGKLDPLQVQICDIAQTHTCNLARYTRKKLHRLGIYSGIKVVFSPEPIDDSRLLITDGNRNKKSVIGTISYLPNIFGCVIASVVVRDLIGVAY